MKNPRSTRKLTLTTETVAHLRPLSALALRAARGGVVVAGGTDWCTGTRCGPVEQND